MKNKITMVKEEEYLEAVESHDGWCPDCEQFTRSNTEPDATEYDCPVCRNRNVVGAEYALISGMIEFEE